MRLTPREHVTSFLFWTWNVKLTKVKKTLSVPLHRKLQAYPFLLETLAVKLPYHINHSTLFLCFYHYFPNVNIYSYEYEDYRADQEWFQENNEEWIKNSLNYMYFYFRYLPEVLSLLYGYYNSAEFKFNLKLDETEFIFLDFWILSLRVLDDFLGELLIRDNPMLLPIPLKGSLYACVYEDNSTLFLYPPTKETAFNEETFKADFLNFLYSSKNFLQVISLYLEARPEFCKACKEQLLTQGKSLESLAIIEYFLTVYIFEVIPGFTKRKVSKMLKRFLMANLFLGESHDLLKLDEKMRLLKWETMSLEEQRETIVAAQESLDKLLKNHLKMKKDGS